MKVEEEKSLLEAKYNAQNNLLEDKWNDKYPKCKIVYRRTETDGVYNIDVRNYINRYAEECPKIPGKTQDEIALNCLKWVIGNITYVSDKTQYGYNEYWAYPYQTLKRKRGDCEDMHILLYNIMLSNGIDYWRIRLVAGNTPSGGHCWLVYYCEEKDKWVCMDACYYPNINHIKDRVDYKKDKLYGIPWFSFNERFCFSSHDTRVGSKNFMGNVKILKRR